MKHLMTLLFILLLLGSHNSKLTESSGNSIMANCDAEIKVSNNMASKSMPYNKMIFDMEIKNISGNTQTYTLFASHLDEDCSNKYYPRKAGESNIALGVELLNTSNKNTIELNSGKSQTFKVKLTAPKGVKYNSWACIEINAKTNTCNTISRPQVLSVYVPNPDEN